MSHYVKRLGRQLLWMPLWLVARLVPRDDRLWVMGAWHGRQYADNACYLFRHVKAHEPQLRAVWLAHDPEVVRQVREDGGEAYLAYSWQGIRVALRAGVALVTHSAQDVNPHALGGRLINLTHGTPLKRFGRDARSSRLGPLTAVFDRLGRHLLPAKRGPEQVVVASAVGQQRMMSAYALPSWRVPVLGYARWDAFEQDAAALLRGAGIEVGDYAGVLLYAPTLRYQGRGSLDLGQGDALLELLPWLRRQRLLLLVRGHVSLTINGLERMLAEAPQQVREVPVARFADVNALLPAVDVLITDYSSVMFDFACLRRPIILMAPDLDDYLQRDVGVYGDYRRDAPGPVIEHWSALPAAWEALETPYQRGRLAAFVARHAALHDGRAAARTVAHLQAMERRSGVCSTP